MHINFLQLIHLDKYSMTASLKSLCFFESFLQISLKVKTMNELALMNGWCGLLLPVKHFPKKEYRFTQ